MAIEFMILSDHMKDNNFQNEGNDNDNSRMSGNNGDGNANKDNIYDKNSNYSNNNAKIIRKIMIMISLLYYQQCNYCCPNANNDNADIKDNDDS